MHDASWTGYHIFLHDIGLSERFIVESMERHVRPYKDVGLSKNWFFLRYWEGGPHVRLRLHGLLSHEADSIERELANDVKQYVGAQPVTREAYYSRQRFDGSPLDIAALPWWNEGSVVRVPYEPEYGRYGGRTAIDVSEELFGVSSRIALRIVTATQENWRRRLNLAIELMVAGAAACLRGSHELGAYFDAYANLWRGHIPTENADRLRFGSAEIAAAATLVDQLANATQPSPGVSHTWRSSLSTAIERLDGIYRDGLLHSPLTGEQVAGENEFRTATGVIVASHIHMLNNRLGVPPAQEHHFARLLQAAMRSVA